MEKQNCLGYIRSLEMIALLKDRSDAVNWLVNFNLGYLRLGKSGMKELTDIWWNGYGIRMVTPQ